MKLVDSHAHLTDKIFENDLDAVISRAKEGGVQKIVSAGYDFSSSKKALGLANAREGIFATAGIHPENVADFDAIFEKIDKNRGKIDKNDDCPNLIFDENFLFEAEKSLEEELEKIEKLAQNEKVVAIGEIGLDFHFLGFLDKQKQEKFGQKLDEEEIKNLKNLQKRAFFAQIDLAQSLKKPIVVHSRDAMGDTFEILKKYHLKRESLLHCFGGSLESAKELVKLGFSFSFGGVVTFKNAKNVQEVVKNLPLERILLETDCPYMSPEPFRGTRNEPKNVLYVADQIARLKNLPIEEVARVTTQNAARLFGL